MQSWLHEHFHITATVLYDRPSQLFKSSTNNSNTTTTDNKDDETNDIIIGMQRPSMQQRHDLLSRLGFTDDKLFPCLEVNQPSKDINNSIDIANSSSSSSSSSSCNSSTKLLVSATSWTADEDFSVLLDALQELERYLCLQDTASLSPHRAADTATAETTVITSPASTTTGAVSVVRLLVVVTGKGPMKAAFEARVKELADKVTTDINSQHT